MPYKALSGDLKYLKVIFLVGLSFFLGWYIVNSFGSNSQRKKKSWKYSILPISSPLIVYILFRAVSVYFLYDLIFVDSIVFGLVCGVITKLLEYSSTNSKGIKVTVIDTKGKQIEIQQESLDSTVGDIRNKIADRFKVTQPGRILIETGKGKNLKNLSQHFLEAVEGQIVENDKYGIKNVTIYIHINDEEEEMDRSYNENTDRSIVLSSKLNPLSIISSLYSKTEMRLGEDYYLAGKAPSTNDESKAFFIQSIDRFMVGSTASNTMSSIVHFEKWLHRNTENSIPNSNISDTISDTTSENLNRISNYSTVSTNNNNHTSPTNQQTTSSSTPIRNLQSFTSMYMSRSPKKMGASIHNGDLVVLEHKGKYLSVMRGWWLAWSSSAPRRSGAFIIEVVERAPKLNIKDSLMMNRRIPWPSISLSTAGVGGGLETLGAIGAINTDYPAQHHPKDIYMTKSTSSSNILNGAPNDHQTHEYVPVSNSATNSRIRRLSLTGSKDNHDNTTSKVSPTQQSSPTNGTSNNTKFNELDTSVIFIGDTFRLRSVKFPDFELGITSENLKGDYFYLGLRKIKDKEKDTWCIPLRFTIKPASTTTEMFNNTRNTLLQRQKEVEQ